jgi:Arc/MetJ-type ribon-helix-helix transcriptional regulator
MTIHLPKDVESSINAAVMSGRFASADDMVAEIVRDYFRQRKIEQPVGQGQGSLGAMRDAAAELDEAVEHAMNLRQRPWRLPHHE